MIFGFFKGDDAHEALREVRREALSSLTPGMTVSALDYYPTMV